MDKEYLHFNVRFDKPEPDVDSSVINQPVFRVYSKDYRYEVGFLRWDSALRKFQWTLTGGYIVMDKEYLLELVELIDTLTKEYEYGKEL